MTLIMQIPVLRQIVAFFSRPTPKPVPVVPMVKKDPPPLMEITHTACLVRIGPDTTITARSTWEREYKKLLAPWTSDRGTEYPAIDPTFLELLEKDPAAFTGSMRTFENTKSEYDPYTYFLSLGQKFLTLALPPQTILQHFFEHPELRTERNWYVVTRRMEDGSVSRENFFLVDFMRHDDGKYSLHCHKCGFWGILGGGWLGNTQKKYFSVPLK